MVRNTHALAVFRQDDCGLLPPPTCLSSYLSFSFSLIVFVFGGVSFFFLFPVRLQVLYTAFADSSFARIDFVDRRRWWTVKSRLSALSDPPKGLEFSPASKTARVVVFNTAGKQYDHLAPKNGCTRGRTCQPTGMVFREFVSSGNTRPTIAAWLLLLRPACIWYLCYNTCGATFILTGAPFIFFT